MLAYLPKLVRRLVHGPVLHPDTQSDRRHLWEQAGRVYTIRSMIGGLYQKSYFFGSRAWLDLKAPASKETDSLLK